MKIVFNETFIARLENQIDFIAMDSPSGARKFKNDLLKKIKAIPKNPYQYRKSIYFNHDSVRDLVFKGYTVVIRIENDRIEIFGFLKYQKDPTD